MKPKRLLFFITFDGIKTDCDISHTAWKYYGWNCDGTTI